MSVISNYFKRSIIKPTKKDIRYNIPRTKQQNLDTLIASTDTLYVSDLEKIGIAHFDTVLKRAEKRLNIKIIPITSRSWEIVR